MRLSATLITLGQTLHFILHLWELSTPKAEALNALRTPFGPRIIINFPYSKITESPTV